jgi:tRNA pseudouridine32 synthase/23S rRNA pseudouridine746 synthase
MGSEPVPDHGELVLHQDARLVVADKPHFMAVTPSGPYLQQSLLVRLKRRLGIDTLVPLHRIDRATAGLVVFSVDPASRGRYQSLFGQRAVRKKYEAIVHWHGGTLPALRYASRLETDSHFLRTREVPGEPNAETTFELLEVRGHFARLALWPVTGRKHQLRVHCNALGLPIVNDGMYPVLQPKHSENLKQPMQLLAQELAFDDPLTGEPLLFRTTRVLSEWPQHQRQVTG